MRGRLVVKNSEQREKHIAEVLRAARTIQDFLWGEHNINWGIEEWRRMFRKRIKMIDTIDPKNPHALIEFRKRLLQNAALCVALLERLEQGIPQEGYPVPSNLSAYKEKKPWLALNAALKVVASGVTEEDAKLKARAIGCSTPVIVHKQDYKG